MHKYITFGWSHGEFFSIPITLQKLTKYVIFNTLQVLSLLLLIETWRPLFFFKNNGGAQWCEDAKKLPEIDSLQFVLKKFLFRAIKFWQMMIRCSFCVFLSFFCTLSVNFSEFFDLISSLIAVSIGHPGGCNFRGKF